jgi:hypothetical protein
MNSRAKLAAEEVNLRIDLEILYRENLVWVTPGVYIDLPPEN